MTGTPRHDTSLDKLHKVQGSLTVGLIMVPRGEMLTCAPGDHAADVKDRNRDNFSFIPVVVGDRVIGLYNAERWFDQDTPDTRVGDDFLPMSEDIVIGADASIFDFIRQADTHPTNLVVSGNRIAGLVSLYDIQQLPVRAALFALITSLEMAMAEAVKARWPRASDWMEGLSDGRRKKLAGLIAKARTDDSFVSEIAFTQFSDKADLIAKGKLLSGSRRALEREFGAIRDLRDKLAHANSYAHTPEAAKGVCEIVRSIYQLKEELFEAITTLTTET